MTGSLYAGSGRKNYYVIINFKDEKGKIAQKWVNTGVPIAGDNKKKAEQAFRRILHEYDVKDNMGILTQPDILFSEYMEQWLERMVMQVQESTLESYQYTLRHIVSYFEAKKIKLGDLKPEHIQKYYYDKMKEGLGANTIIKHHSNIHKALSTALKHNLILFNPADRVDLPRKTKYQANIYDDDLMRELLVNVKGSTIEAPVTITVFLGLRRSEVLGLKWSAINIRHKTLVIQTTVVRSKSIIKKDTTKNNSSHRTLSLPESLCAYLISLKERQEEDKQLYGNCYNENDWVCKGEDGTPLTPTALSHRYSKLLKETGLPPIRFHDLRHSCASMLLNAGCELYEIKELLGHSQIATTIDIYGHLDFKSKRRMASKINDILSPVQNRIISKY